MLKMWEKSWSHFRFILQAHTEAMTGIKHKAAYEPQSFF